MDAIIKEMHEHIKRYLQNANEALLGLHRYSALTYPQYAEVANLLIEAEERLRRFLSGEESTAGVDSGTIPIPLWLFHNSELSPLAKWTYGYLLKMRREFCRPGRSALVINITLAGRDIFSPYAWTEKHLLSAIRELTEKGMIASHKMEYPDTTPEHWEIDFLREEMF